ncbi:MAG: SDR family NAD(P)-dependent oxidoreductase [Proteobacteria bacterium]|nr:SDR family NAD(P)-dependent oxidoreductase [Pseudomonadota bacterium]
MSQKVVFLGATRGMGRALARLLAARGDVLCLLGRQADDLARSAADLEAYGESYGARAVAGTALCDLEQPATFAPALEAAERLLSRPDLVVVSAGVFAPQDALEDDPALAARLLAVDFTNTVLFCEEARKRLLAQGGGTLCVFSSVAGDRGRKPVAIYGAAKAGLSHYLESLDHKYRAAGLRTICVKPGFVRTGMTAGLKEPPFAGDPQDVARRVLRAIDRGEPVVYAPAAWRAVMAVIRALPRQVMRRVDF